jgi:DNA-directed RNA polymerase specialized sigma24 family protein
MAVMQLPRRGRTRVEFERFVDTCAGELLRTGYLVVWDLEESEDLVQETLLRVARRCRTCVGWTSRSHTRAAESSPRPSR